MAYRPERTQTSGRSRGGWSLRRALRCRRGTAIIEFALAAPVVILATALVFEIAMMMFVEALLEGGLREAARFGITGYSPAGVSREDQIRQIVAKNTLGLVDMNAATIEERVYPAFGDVGKPEPFVDQAPANGHYDPGEPFQDINGNGRWDADMGVAGVGGPGDVVLYTVEIDWRPLTPLAAPLLGGDGKIPMHASVVVRNEPYQDAEGGGATP